MAEETVSKNLMTEGNIYRKLLLFALPVFIGHLFQQLYNTADSLIVGNLLGREALAAVSSTGSVVYLEVGFFMGFSMGAGVVIARNIGARDGPGTEKAVHTAVVMGLCFSLLVTLVGVFFSPVMLRWMGTPEDVIGLASRYLRFYFAGSTGLVMYNTFVGILQASGDSRHPLRYLIFSSLLNVVLDVAFIGGLGMGVEGAAIATAISQFASMLLALCRLVRSDEAVRVSLSKLRVDWPSFREIVRNGLPTALQSSIIDLSNVLIQSYVNSFGSLAVAGMGAYSKVEGFAFLPVTAFSMALSTFMSQNLGAGKRDRMRQGMRFGLVCAVIATEVIGILFFTFAPQIISAFNRDPDVIAFGVLRARICSLFYCLVSFSHVSSAVMRGVGRPVVPMAVMLGCWCAVRVAVFMTLGQIWHNILFTCWIYPVTWMLSTVVYLLYLRHLRREGVL